MASPRFQVEPFPGFPHSHTIILLHGRDNAGTQFADEFFRCEAYTLPGGLRQDLRDLFPTVRWVFLSAPDRYSLRFDEMVPQWFDVWSTEEPHEYPELQAEGLHQSVETTAEVVREQEEDIPKQNIILGGVSQGFTAVVAALPAIGSGLGGLVGFSGWVPATIATELAENPRQDLFDAALEATQVFVAHSADDVVVPIS